MMISQTVAELLADHVRLTVEGIDRMYLNVYVPRLQCAYGAVSFFRDHRGQPLASSALMSPMSRRFVAELDRFIVRHHLPVVLFRKGQRKDAVMVERLRDFPLKEGVVFCWQGTAPPQLASHNTSTKSIAASLHRSTDSHWPHET